MLTQLEGELGKLKETGNELTVAFKDGAPVEQRENLDQVANAQGW
ncbi:hypothetical protein [Pectobacterium aroidearum]|nr:hypothetical protein [Pectobacterium aroidearum]